MSTDLNKIGQEYNYDNNYFRMVLVALAKTLNRNIRWVYRFETQKVCVSLPFYTSMTGDQRFLVDSFIDDITDTRVELNTDQKQRGMIVLENFSLTSDEYANPNIYAGRILTNAQKINTERDKVKSEFALKHNMKLFYIWEQDILKNDFSALDKVCEYINEQT